MSLIVALIVVLVVAGGAYYWFFMRGKGGGASMPAEDSEGQDLSMPDHEQHTMDSDPGTMDSGMNTGSDDHQDHQNNV